MKIKLTKNGQIFISKKIQNQLDFHEGDSLFVHTYKDSIIIEKNHHNKLLNQCVLSYGRISIPVELRRLLGISEMTSLSMKVSIEQGIIFIRKVKELLY